MASNNNLEHTDIPTNTNSEDEASQTTTPDAVYNLPVNIPPPASTPNNSLDFLIYVSPESISTVSTVTSPELLISSSAITSGKLNMIYYVVMGSYTFVNEHLHKIYFCM